MLEGRSLERLVVDGLLDDAALSRRSWEPFRQGIEVSWLYRSESGASAALLRYQAGASVPRHAHDGLEHIIVLQGEQQDERGVYPRGTLLVHDRGTQHSVSSRAGCLVLAIWSKPVRFC